MKNFSRSIKRFLGMTRSPIQRPLRSKMNVEAFEDRITPAAFPTPLVPLSPVGSLMYTLPTNVSDSISVAGTTDSYTINLDAGQKLSIGMFPDVGLQGSVQILDPSSVVIGSGSSAAAGAPASVQNVAVTAAGTYTVNFSGLASTTGSFTASLGLNVQGEAELPGTTTNNTTLTAESINGSAVSLGGGVTRLAVVGTGDPAPILYSAAAVTPAFTDISSTGTLAFSNAVNNDDTSSGSIALPFSFSVYGTSYTTAFVNPNGFITFGATYSGGSSWVNTDLSAANPAQATVAPFWDDLYAQATTSSVRYQTVGSNFVVQWSNLSLSDDSSKLGGITFQAILSQNGNIKFNYGSLVSNGSAHAAHDNGISATVGVKPAGVPTANQTVLAFNNGPNSYVNSNLSTTLTPPSTSPDIYSLTLTSGQKNTAVVTGLAAGTFSLSLLDSTGTVLQTGTTLSNFTVPTTGTYFLKVTGTPNVQYSLVVTENAAFEKSPDSTIATAQNISGTTGVLGYATSTSFSSYTAAATTNSGFDTDISSTGTGITFTDVDDGATQIPIGFSFPFFGTTQTSVYVGTNGILSFGSPVTSYFNTDLTTSPPTAEVIAPLWDDYVVDVGSVNYQVVNPGTPQMALIVQWTNVSVFRESGIGGNNFQAILGANGSIVFEYGSLIVDGSSATVGLHDATGGAVQLDFNGAPADFNTYVGSNLTTTLTGIPAPDIYAVTLTGSQGGLLISTSTPGDGPGEFVNTLNPTIALYDSTNTLVATGTVGADGRNETLAASNLVPTATYYVKVLPEGGTSGEYFLSYATTPATATSTALVATPTSALAGTAFNFTATVTPTPGNVGTVNFLDGGFAIPGGSNVAIVSGQAQFSISTLPAGVHHITAVFSGAPGLAVSTSNNFDITVNTGAPTTTVINSATPNPAALNQSIAYTVTVSGGAAPTGEQITLFDTDTSSVVTTTGGILAADGTTTITITAGALTIGTHHIVARYAADASNLASQSDATTQTITLNPTTTTLTAPYVASVLSPGFLDITTTGTVVTLANPDDGGTDVPIGFNFPFYSASYSTVHVGSNGVLSFGDSNTIYYPPSLTTSAFPEAIIAPYWADLQTSTGAVYSQLVGTGSTAKLIVEWNNVSYWSGGGENGGLTFEAVLGADGSVQFNYNTLTSNNPNGNQAAVGVKDASATSSQNLQVFFGTSTTPGFNTFVGPGLSTGISAGAPANHASTTPITYQVTVAGGATTGESFTLIDTNHGNAVVPYTGGPLSGGTATITVLPTAFPANTIPLDTHNLVAVYPGDASNATSTSAVLGQVLFQTIATTTTASTTTSSPVTSADTVTINVHVSATGGPVDGETVAIHDGATNITVTGNTLDSSGNATITIPAGALTPGDHNLVAYYPGDLSNAASTSTPTIPMHVNAVTSTTLTTGYTASAVGFSYTDISATGTPITFGNTDDGATNIPLGFNFPFFGNTYTDINVGTNGVLTFGATSITAYSNAALPTTLATEVIAPYWDDLMASPGSVYYGTSGTSFIIQYSNVSYYANGSTSGGVNFEVVLGADGSIQFNYQNLLSFQGNSATVGISDPTATFQLDYNGSPATYTNYVGDGKSTLIAPPPAAVDHASTIPLKYTITVSGGATAGETVQLVDSNHGNAIVPFTGGPLTNVVVGGVTVQQMVVSVLPTDFPSNLSQTDTHNLVAKYLGDANNLPSDSAPFAQVLYVTIPTTTVVTAPLPINPATTNDSLTFNVTVTADPGSGGAVTGETVVLYDGTTVVPTTGGVLAADGTTTLTVAAGALAPGVHNLSVHFLGDAFNSPSASTVIAETVHGVTTTTLTVGYTSGPVTPSFLEISQTGSIVPVQTAGVPDLDDGTASMTIPFNFQFYGTTYTNLNISANGVLGLGDPSVADLLTSNNENLATSSNQPIIAPYWNDLLFTNSGGNVFSQVIGDGGPNQQLVIEWYHAGYWALAGQGNATFEVIISANGSIEFNYQSLSQPYNNAFTVGIKGDGAGAPFTQYYGVSPATALFAGFPSQIGNNLSDLFTPPPASVDLSDTTPVIYTITVSGGASTNGEVVTLHDNTIGADVGTGVLSGGVATISVNPALFVSAGTHNLVANYAATALNNGSQSPVYQQIVTAKVTTVTIASTTAADPTTLLDPIDFTVTVSTGVGGGSTDGEYVSLFDTTTGLTVATTGGLLSGGTTTISVSPGALSPGAHTLVAVYGGDATNHSSASSPPITRHVKGSPTTAIYPYTSMVTPTFEDISTTGTAIAFTSNNTGATNVPASSLSGFSFPFYGTTYSDVNVSVDGLITFGGTFVTGTAANNNFPLTSTSAPALPTIAPLWVNMSLDGTGGASKILYQVVGSGASQHLVIEWFNVSYVFDAYNPPSVPGGLTFEAVLGLDGSIQFNYSTLTTVGIYGGAEGKYATIGIGNAGANVVQLGFFNNPPTPNGLVGSGLSTKLTPTFGSRYSSDTIPLTVSVTGGLPVTGTSVTIHDITGGGDVVVPTTVGTLNASGYETLNILPGALAAGSHDLVAVYSSTATNTTSISPIFTQVILPAPVNLSPVTVNGGSAYSAFAGSQRSDVVSFQLSFDSPVTLDASALAMTVHANNLNEGAIPTLNATTTDGGLTYVVTFSGPNTDPTFTDPSGALFGTGAPANGFHSLSDGVYDFTVDLSHVHLASNPAITGSGTSTTVVSRLFGNVDTTGEVSGANHTATVNTADNLQFRAAFNTPANYQAYFDFDGNGQINTADNLQFRNRFNHPLSWTE